MPTPPLSEIDIAGGDGPGPLPEGPLAPEANTAGTTAAGTAAPSPEAEGWATPELRRQLWWVAGTLYRWRWLLLAIVVLAGALSVWYALSLNNRYRAETRVLLPEKGDAFGGILESVAPGASAILGGAGGAGYTRYLAILTSRTTMEEIVDEFDLVDVYETGDKANPRAEAVGELVENTGFFASLEYDYLAVTVLDENPDRAARMANRFVELLNRRHIEFNSGAANEDREFLSVRLEEAQLALDSAQAELQAFQERNGVIEIEAQSSALMTAIGEARGRVAEAEVQYDALRSQYGEENPDVQTARAGLESARASLRSLQDGGEAVMPVPIRNLPAVGRRYAQIFQELTTQQQIVAALRPMYEQAVLSERRDADAVQVLDEAVPPSKKAEPRRSILVLSMTVAAGVLSALLVLFVAWWRQRKGALVEKLQAAA